LSTSTLAKYFNWMFKIFSSCSFHAIPYTRKYTRSQGKSGEFKETPNVKSRAILSQATKGIGFVEGATTMKVSPNNNPSHERPTRKGKDSLSYMETYRTMV
jgi:hypothetical protein